MTDYVFWLVWAPNKSLPKTQHPSLHEANAEAKRLAALEPGVDFVVLQAVGLARTGQMPVEYTHLAIAPEVAPHA